MFGPPRIRRADKARSRRRGSPGSGDDLLPASHRRAGQPPRL